MSTKLNICEELLLLRRRAKLSQGAVARAIGVERNLICHIELGRVTPNEEMAAKIKKAIENMVCERV